MHFAKFKKFFPIAPEFGEGILEQSNLLITENELAGFSQAILRESSFEDAVELSDVPTDKIYRGQEVLPPNSKVAFYYPAGMGDAACHTALVCAFKNKFPDATIRVFCHPSCAGVWFLNPFIEYRCARAMRPTKEALDDCDIWLLGDSVVYKLTGSDQPNIYSVLSDHFQIPLALNQQRPFMFVSSEETAALDAKLKNFGLNILEEATMIFAPIATRVNRCWPDRHWKELVHQIQREMGFRVLALGDRASASKLSILAETCAVLCGALTPREMVVLTHQADRVITVDTSFLHFAAAFEVPTVSLFGAFTPKSRASTYPYSHNIWLKDSCANAGCSYHDHGFPEGLCPHKEEQQACQPMDDLTPRMILDELRNMESAPKIIQADSVRKASGVMRFYDRGSKRLN